MDFRKTIRKELQRQGMTQARLAELSGMTIPRVSTYLNAKRDVQGETLRRIFEALGIQVQVGSSRKPSTRKAR